ncbi:hypothetical protein HDV02_000411 [Globomyces sp. JEL0801]|nr:hypothetical protein HDV02_000411 [Globomyces sp. JEL0801]
MDEMRKFYEGQLEGANLSSETEIKKLQGTIDVLQAENDRLEFELTTTTTDRSTKELELQAIRQQMAIVDKILKQEKAEFVEKISNLQEQVYDLQISEATAVERAADFQKENEIITEEKEHLSQELRRVSVLLKETQDAFEQKTQSEAKLTILLEEKTSENEILKLEKERLEVMKIRNLPLDGREEKR